MEEYILGVDVSHWQGKRIDWEKTASSGAKFAFIKVTEGSSYFDSCFEQNWLGAQAAGLKVGAYHMVRFDVPPESQINWLKAKLDMVSPGTFPVVLDCELAYGKDKVYTISKISDAFPEVIIYTAMNWWNINIKPFAGSKELSRFPLWVANYTLAKQPVVPYGWDDWAIWQYTQRGDGKLYGVNQYDSRYIDLNRMKPEFWNKYIKPKAKRKKRKWRKLKDNWKF